ncbi:MAG: nitroreductase family protein [Bacteroidota bacterium]|nr:nitroreductase family protein [Bacteroidota bacterium]
MSFIEFARKRHSVRSFKAQSVEQEKIEYLLEAARIAPSAVNFQPWKMIVVTDKALLNQLQDCYPREWFSTAPACIVVCGDHNRSWKRSSDEKDYCDVDVAIAITHLTLAAADQGLGTCWICNFDVRKCVATLSIPKHMEPIAIIPIGYPTDPEDLTEEDKQRKPLSELVEYR